MATCTVPPSVTPSNPLALLQVRREAVRCLGLYCTLDGIPTSLSSHLVVLRQVRLSRALRARGCMGGAGSCKGRGDSTVEQVC